ncbi:hypothetical protein [Bacillus andreraoultii]|nr:hypothetical protein [Bacillus andreraoultii]
MRHMKKILTYANTLYGNETLGAVFLENDTDLNLRPMDQFSHSELEE